ncbi:MAG: adenylate/guanylate cyclase domain-containing protein [Alphaproteobacteria bacterium]|nr:adenylate/guanylate cyclase domain-containing protein [Alphaproteobacteria bacterium]
MRRRPHLLIAGAVLMSALGLRLADPPSIEHVRLAVFDEYQRLKPRPWADAGVAIIDIDDESLKRLGQWPWPRTRLAALIERLGAMGATAVGFDVVFAEPDRTSPAQVLPLWPGAAGDPSVAQLMERLPDHDAGLAKAMAATPTVLGMILTARATGQKPPTKWGIALAGDDPRPFLPTFAGAVTNLSLFESVAAGEGSFNSAIDRDGMIRRVPIMLRLADHQGTDELFPSLVAEALRVAQGASTYVIKSSGANGVAAWGAHTGVSQIRIGQVTVPTDSRARIWLYDTGFVPQRFIPAWQIFEPDFDAKRLEGRILFIGTSAVGLKDIRATPLNPAAAGVELHAQAVEQMILGEFLERPDWMTGAEITWLLVFGLALIVLLPQWGATWCALTATAAVAATLGLSWLAFTQLGWLVDPVYPSVAVVLLYLTQSFLLFLRTEADRRQVRGAFSRYMSPAVVERVARDPDLLRMGGEIREMTILFSDIRGFTSISETMDAHTLTRFMNRFLTQMTDVILRRDGTIDKYMGDAIMAFWNAPLDDPDHATHAARAALEMTTSLEALNATWAADAVAHDKRHQHIAIGVGLNTGTCCVGNFGSDQRIDYSVLGDAVNLASRLEGQSKTYGVSIVIGERTRESLPAFACLELDLIQVKGKAQAVHIYALLGDEAAAIEPWFQEANDAQEAMLAAYRAQEWERAAAAVERVRRAAAGRLDGLCDVYVDRIDRFSKAPPPAGWNGVYEAAQK